MADEVDRALKVRRCFGCLFFSIREGTTTKKANKRTTKAQLCLQLGVHCGHLRLEMRHVSPHRTARPGQTPSPHNVRHHALRDTMGCGFTVSHGFPMQPPRTVERSHCQPMPNPRTTSPPRPTHLAILLLLFKLTRRTGHPMGRCRDL